MRSYQLNIDKPTQQLDRHILEELTKSQETTFGINTYRRLKQQMNEAKAQGELAVFVKDMLQTASYKAWLKEMKMQDAKRRKQKTPDDDAKRVALFINTMKTSLPAVILTANFTQSVDRWKRSDYWRIQANGYLTGLVVLDLDHVPNAEELIAGWLQREDFNELGIVWIFITPSGEGIKVVFKARLEWGNLIDNSYQLAEMLGVLDYADSQCKNSDHTHFIPRFEDIKFIDWEELFNYENPAFEERYGEAYRRGESDPTQPRWQELERLRKESRKSMELGLKPAEKIEAAPQAQTSTEPKTSPTELTERDLAIVKMFNAYYGPSLPSGQRHPTFTEELSHWMCWVCDNDPEKAINLSFHLDWVNDWQPRPGEVEGLINSAAEKKLLTRCPKKLKELLEQAGIETARNKEAQTMSAETELPFDQWIEQIRGLFDTFPCIREVCEPHPERLWPFLLFASAALLGTDMTLTWYYFYDNPEKKRRLNYNVLGVGDPASGKGALVRIAGLLSEPIEQGDQLANDAINNWKEEQRSKGANKDKSAKPKGIIRQHGARTSNNVFITDMVNAWEEVNGERMQKHVLTVDTEALNSIKLQKGGSWIDKQVMEIKAWSNEKDSQQYANLDSVTGFFHVYWNLVRTCTPPALKQLVNEANFGTGYPTRLSVIPVPGTGFKMIELRRYSQKAIEADETLVQWAYRLDKRQGELPLWPLVEHAWNWTNDRMEIAAFNEDKADELLLKRCAANALAVVAPFVDMHHWEEREKTGSYEVDDMDKALLDLVLDIQYRTQHYYFGELARNYFDEQMKDATLFRRRTTRFEQCYIQLPDEFTTEQFAQVFGYANPRSAAKTIDRFLKDKTIERTKRGEYRKRVQNIR